MALPEDLAEAVARIALGAGPFAQHVRFLPVVGSTNDEAARLAAEGAPDGTVVIADEQTAGRGSHGRAWHSPAEAGVYLSILFRPGDATSNPQLLATTWLTVMGGVAAAEGIRHATGLAVAIKWPNDIVVEAVTPVAGAPRRRKLAGLLAEAAVSGNVLQHVILGVGVNLRDVPRPPEIAGRATSLEAELGRPCERGVVVEGILEAVAGWRQRLLDGDVTSLLRRWCELSPSSHGARVSWQSPTGARHGVTRGIDGGGALLVDTPHGRERVISAELSWE